MKSIILLVATVIMVILGFTGIANVYGQEKVENYYFSLKIPDSWAYVESSETPESRTTGYGPTNFIQLTPSEFSDTLHAENSERTVEGVVGALFSQDTDYRIKNAPLESYVKYVIAKLGIQNITSQHYTTVGKEKAVRIDANLSAEYGPAKGIFYLVMHDKLPYAIAYTGNPKNYEKYLPEFEQMVKSFKFQGSASSQDNGNLTNTQSNFSSANLTDYNATSNSNYPEELYDECVGVAGESFCDFLFKR